MRLTSGAVLVSILGLGAAADALAQPRDVPVQRDLRRMEQLDRQLGRSPSGRVDPNVTPDNPDGVVGFDGPPDLDGEDIINSDPLPPGAPVDEDED